MEFLGKMLSGATLAPLFRVRTASTVAHCEIDAEHDVRFLPLFTKAEILFGLVSVTKKQGLRSVFCKNTVV